MIKSFIRSVLPSGGFARGVAVLAGGNSLGQLISLAASPILTRLYSPQDFGLLAVYLSITTIVSVVICLRYEIAIALPDTREEAVNTAVLSMSFALLLSVVSLVVVYFLGDAIVGLLGVQDLGRVVWLLPISFLLLGLFSSLSYLFVREKNYSLLGKVRIFQVCSSVTTQISLSVFGAVVLVFGQLASQLVGVFLLAKRSYRDFSFKMVSSRGMYDAMVRYKRFPLLSTWAALLNRISSQLPTLLFAVMFGPAVAGLFALAMRVVNAPSGILSKALHYVFLGSVSEAYKNGNAATLTQKTFDKLTRLTVPPLMFFALLAPVLFDFLFGERWVTAGYFSQWITLLVFGTLVVAPMMVLFSVMEKQGHEFVLQMLIFLFRLLALYIGWKNESAMLAVALYCCVSFVGYLTFVCWLRFSLGIRLMDVARSLAFSVLVGAVVCLPTLFAEINAYTGGAYLLLVVLSLAILLAYGFQSYRMVVKRA